jgi:hydroxymethylbilane synthase
VTIQTIRIATRKSKLALWQAEFIKARLLAAHPELTVELVGMTTSGDKWLSTPLGDWRKRTFHQGSWQPLAGRAENAVH